MGAVMPAAPMLCIALFDFPHCFEVHLMKTLAAYMPPYLHMAEQAEAPPCQPKERVSFGRECKRDGQAD